MGDETDIAEGGIIVSVEDFVIEKGKLEEYRGNETDIVIPEGVTSISLWAFRPSISPKITSIILPESLVDICFHAFDGLSQLRSIRLPMGVKNVEQYAFDGCKGLTTFIVENKNTKLGKDLFGDELPEGLKAQVMDFWRQLPDGTLKKYIFQSGVWKTLSADQKAEIFLAKQGKPLIPVYIESIRGDEAVRIGEAIVKRLETGATSKEETAAAVFLSIIQDYLSDDLMQTMLRFIETDKKAMKVIEYDTRLQQRLASSSEPESRNPVETIVKKRLEEANDTIMTIETSVMEYYGITADSLPEIRDREGNRLEPFVLAWLLTVHEQLEKEPGSKPWVRPDYRMPGIKEEASEVVALLDESSLQDALVKLADDHLGLSGFTKKMFLARPVCRYGDEMTMAELTKRAPKWRSGVSGNNAPPLRIFRNAALYSNTRSAMMFSEKCMDLDAYASLRGTDAQTLRDEYMSDVGLDENGKKTYDLGNTILELSLGDDLSLNLSDTRTGKVVKSVPKKGADPEKYESAKADIADLKKNVKKLVKMRADLLFQAFLDGRTFEAENWRKVYLSNPLLNHVANLVVWEQNGKTFVPKKKDLIDSAGTVVELTDSPIRVAHPMEMQTCMLEQWKKYFIEHQLKQPFEQVWEPVKKAEEVTSDRYAGSILPLYRFVGKDRHGITADGFFAYSERYSINFTDCDLELKNPGWRLDGNAGRDADVTLGSFTFEKFTRYTNHIVGLLDRWTVESRVLKDDMTVVDLLPGFTQVQIAGFIKAAGENNCNNVMAVLLDYKNRNFGYDPMEELILEL